MLVREPFSGITREVYRHLPDRDLVEVYFAPRDDDHALIPQSRRRREAREAAENTAKGLDRRGFPKPEAVGLTPELLAKAVAVNPRIPVSYTIMFFQVLGNQGLPPDEVWKRYEAKARAGIN